MPAEIDRLEIAIEAKSKGASDQVDRLINKLASLSSALTRTGTVGFKALSDSANHATTSIRNLATSINSANLNKVTAQLTALSKIDLSNLSKGVKVDIKFDGANNVQKQAMAVQQSTDQIWKTAEKAADAFLAKYRITGKEAQRITREMFKQQVGNSFGMVAGSGDINDVAEQLAKSTRMTKGELQAATQGYTDGLQSEWQEFLDFVNKHKIKYIKDVQDIANYMQAVGAKDSFTNLFSKNGGIDLDTGYEQLQSMFPNILKDIDNIGDRTEYIINKIKEAKEVTQTYSISDLGKSADDAFLDDYVNSIVAAGQKAKQAVEAAKASLTTDKIVVDIDVNQQKIIDDIQNAVNSAAHIKYNPVNVGLKVDTTQIKRDIAGQFASVDLSGIDAVNNALQKLNVAIANLKNAQGKSDFSKIIGSLKKINDIDASKIEEIGKELEKLAVQISGIQSSSEGVANITEVLNAVRKFGGKGVTNAVTNIPLLADAIKKMLDILATAPAINPETIAALQAAASIRVNASGGSQGGSRSSGRAGGYSSLGSIGQSLSGAVKASGKGLATAGKGILGIGKDTLQTSVSLYSKLGKIGASAVSAGKKLLEFSKKTQQSTFSMRGMANALGRLYAKFFILRRAIGFFSEAFTGAMDYIESYHYFEVAFDKIGEGAKNDFAQYGYDSAEAYADSFKKRALDLNTKMTGFEFNEAGYATSTGKKSLGLDSDQLLQYQAQYAQMADSIGMTGEAATATSKALSMLATDWSSLRNISFEESYQKMTSALAGQSRAVRSLGIDITQATLAETAANIGMTTSISKMNQVEKAELRVITMLEQSRVAWGDLAETLNTPANQLRMLQQNLKSLARTIGNLFLPVLAKIIPYINGIVIALQRLFQWIINILGLDIGDLVSSAGGMDDALGDLGGDSLDDFTEGANDAADALEDAEEEAEELVKTILGFDELNILNPPKEEEEEKEEDNPLDDLDSQLADMDLLDSALLKLLDEYEQAWQKAFENMASAAHEFADKLAEIGRKIWDFIKNKDYEGLGEYLAEGVNWILQKLYDLLDPERFRALVYPIIDAFTETFNSLVDHIDWDLLGRLLGRGLNDLIDAAIRFIEGIDWGALGRALAKAINGLFDEIDWANLGRYLADKFMALIDFLKGFLEELDGKQVGESLANMLNSAMDYIDWVELGDTLALGLNKAIDILDAFIDTFHWDDLANNLSSAINSFIEGVKWARLGQVLGKLVDNLLHTFFKCVAQIRWDELAIGIVNGLTMFIASIHWEERASELAAAFNSILNGIYTAITNFDFKWAGSRLGAALKVLLDEVDWGMLGYNLLGAVNGMLLYIQGIIETPGFFDSLGMAFANFLNGALSVGTLVTASEVVVGAINGLIDSAKSFIENFHWWTLGEQLKTSINNMINGIRWRELGETIDKFFKKVLSTLEDVVKDVDFYQLGVNVATAIGEVDWLYHFNTVKDIIFKALGDFFSGVLAEALGPFGENFAKGFVEGVQSVVDIGESAITGVAAALKLLAEAIGMLPPETIEAVGSALGTFFALKVAEGLAVKMLGVITQLVTLKGLVGGSFAGDVTSSASALSKFAGSLKGLGAVSAGIAAHNAMEEIVDEGGDFGGASGIASSTIDMLDRLATVIGTIGENSGISQEQVEKIREQLEGIGNSSSAYEALQNTAQAFYEAGVKSGDLRTSLGDLTDDQRIILDFLEALEEDTGKVATAESNAKDKTEELYKYLDLTDFTDPIFAYANLYEIIDQLAERYGVTYRNADELREAMINSTNPADTAKDSFEKIKDVLEKLGYDTDSLTDIFAKHFPEAVREGTREAQSAAEEGAEGISEPINSALDSVKENSKETMGQVKEDVQEVGDKTAEANQSLNPFEKLIDALATGVSGISESMKVGMVSGAIKEIAKNSGDSEGALSALTDEIDRYAEDDSLINHTADISEALQNANIDVEAFADSLAKQFENANVAITPEIAEILAQIDDMAVEARKRADNVGEEIDEGGTEGVEDKKQGFFDAIKSLFTGGIDVAEDTVDSHSPSRVFREIGWNLDLGLKEGVEEFKSEPLDAIKMLAIEMQNEFSDIAEQIPDAFANISYDIASNFNGVEREIRYAIGDMYSLGREASQSFADGIQSVYIKLPHVSWAGDYVHSYDGGTIYIPQFQIDWYATGGFPRVGDMFIANEAGPEMVGKMGHRNVVANNQQIVEGIKEGFIDAVMEVAMVSGGDDTPYQMNINLVMPDGEVLARQVDRGRMKREQRFRFA